MYRFLIGFLLVALPLPAMAADGPPEFRIEATTPSLRRAIELGSGPGKEQWEAFMDQVSVRNVTGAAIYPFLPRAGHANGKAVIVVPGGGYRFVSIDSEGFRVAEALAAQGYTAFVLKYRTVTTARDIPTYMADTGKLFANLGKAKLDDNPPAVDDLATAIQHVRANAAQWQINPAKVDVVGFSAGSRTAIRLMETKREAGLIAGVGLIYPPMTETVTAGPRPPLFLAIAADDPLFKQGGLNLLQNWLTESPKVEFHLYSGGSHGFGMRANGSTSDLWSGQYLAWLERR